MANNHWYDEVLKIMGNKHSITLHEVESFHRVSDQCIDLIKHFEGWYNDAYLCPAGVPTIGVGFTKGVKLGDHMTDAQIRSRLDLELKGFQDGVKRSINIPITQSMFDACVSFSFNLGNGAFAGSTLLRKLNSGDYIGASNEFGKWINANGKVLLGLQRRRDAERLMFLGKDWIDYRRSW